MTCDAPPKERPEAFYRLAPAAEGSFWAITWRALYRFGVDGKKEREYALPKLMSVSGVYLSRELPGVLLVRTDVNWAVSTSGATPLIIPLQNSRTQVAAVICGRKDCVNAGKIWLKVAEEGAYQKGERIFEIHTRTAKVRVQ